MSFINSKSEAIRRLQARLFNSRFFTISVILHLFLVLILGSAVIIQSSAPPADFTGGEEGKFVQDQQQAPPPPPPPQQTQTLSSPVQNKNLTETIRSTNMNAPAFVAPVITNVPAPTTATVPNEGPPAAGPGRRAEHEAVAGDQGLYLVDQEGRPRKGQLADHARI
jgi:hypothetical protein